MDLTAIRTFCRTVETGNLSRAADNMHITKSVASRRIQALEDDLGVRLLSRTTRGVTPTDEGLRFYEQAVRILDELAEARQNLAGEDGMLRGRLRMTAPRAFTDIILRRALGDFLADNPKLEMEIDLADSRVDIARAGYDLAVRIARQLDDTSLIAKKLCTINNDCVASPDYLAAAGIPVQPEDLSKHQCIYYSHLAASTQWQFQTQTGPKSVRVTGSFATNSGIMQREAALRGQGISVLPRFFIHDQVQSGELVRLMPSTPPVSSGLYVLYPERRFTPRRVRALIDHLGCWCADPRNSADF